MKHCGEELEFLYRGFYFDWYFCNVCGREIKVEMMSGEIWN